MAKIIALANQKGGVSKTTSSLNICYSFAQKGRKALLIDFDSQGSSSLNLGIDVASDEINTIEELLVKFMDDPKSITYEDVKPYIYKPTFETNERIEGTTKWQRVNKEFGFDVIPASLNLATVEMQMMLRGGRTVSGKAYPFYLRDICKVLNDKYDFIVIDTAPSLSYLSINAMCASTSGIIVPSNLDIMSFRGIGSFIDTANEAVQIAKNAKEEHRGILGVLLSLYSERRTVDNALARYIIDFYPVPVFKTRIIDSSDAKKANASMLLFSQVNKKAKACFDNLTTEIEEAINYPDKWKQEAKDTYMQTKQEEGE